MYLTYRTAVAGHLFSASLFSTPVLPEREQAQKWGIIYYFENCCRLGGTLISRETINHKVTRWLCSESPLPPLDYDSDYSKDLDDDKDSDYVQDSGNSADDESMSEVYVPALRTCIVVDTSAIGTKGPLPVFTVVLTVLPLGISCSMFVMGATYFHDCKAENMLPVFLMVFGIVGCAEVLYRIWRNCKVNDDEVGKIYWRDIVEAFVLLFLLAWFVAGSVYTYRNLGTSQSDDEDMDNYCNYSLYWFSVGINATFIITVMLVVSYVKLKNK